MSPDSAKNKYKACLVGFGKIAQGYSQDPVMAEVMRYTTHAQVLKDHEQIDWISVVDPSEAAREAAQTDWQIEKAFASPQEHVNREEIEILILATPPGERMASLTAFPALKAVIMEKPLAPDMESAREVIEYCRQHNILVQVNLLRRGDQLTRSLMHGGIEAYTGKVISIFGLYGNGLKNNGLHMIDVVRMTMGDIYSVRALSGTQIAESPMPGDFGIPFQLTVKQEDRLIPVCFTPVPFSKYRENGMQFFGERGRFDYWHGGLTLSASPLAPSRMGGGEMELAHDKPGRIDATMGEALYNMYSNLIDALTKDKPLYSTGQSALGSTAVVEAILRSAQSQGEEIVLAGD